LKSMKERLQKIISRSGVASRRKAENMIVQGRVAVNGQPVTELGARADSAKDVITIDGEAIASPENRVFVILNKPAGCLCTRTDPGNRTTVLDLLKDIAERIYPVGRLDYDTEGLLVLTNDGEFSQKLLHPSSHLARTYRVKVREIPSEKDLDRLRRGILIDRIKTNPAKIKIVDRLQKNCWLEVTLWEGRNRQIKKMFESIGHRTLRIIRTRFGPLELKDLPTGAYRFMTRKELNAVRTTAQKKTTA